MDAPLVKLSNLIDLLREKRVRVYRGTETSTELELEPTVIEHPPEKPAPDPDVCRCGHASHEHGPDGLCLRGCDVETCAPKEGPS